MADAAVRPWTRDELARLPDDGNRYEVLDGALFVTPMPSGPHQWSAGRLFAALDAYCLQHGIGVVLAPTAVVWKKNELQPDLGVVPCAPTELVGRKWEQYPLPILVVEIASRSTRSRDATRKRDAYRSLGIAEYWMVGLDPAQVTIVRPNAEDEIVTDFLRWQPLASAPPLELPLAEFLLPAP